MVTKYGENPGLRVSPVFHRVSPAIDPADDWVVNLLIGNGRLENRIELKEGREIEGEPSEKVFLVGKPEGGTVHAIVVNR